ncbi:MAG: hypothetical protein HDT39_09190 [Lachnospiraceae bacterium]|nr:hypothetical protein [Lachnospiraceae bacterium]
MKFIFYYLSFCYCMFAYWLHNWFVSFDIKYLFKYVYDNGLNQISEKIEGISEIEQTNLCFRIEI